MTTTAATPQQTERPERKRVHLVAGGFPPGRPAGHDHDYARLQLLDILQQHDHVHTTVAGDFTDLEKWLPECRFLITYVAGPVADDEQNRVLREWIEDGGRWLALHGSSGGRAVRDKVQEGRRRMMKQPYHETLGGFFINHPPIRRFQVDVADPDHPLTRGLPASWETIDEPYMIELQQPPDCQILLTSELGPDNTPPDRGFLYDQDTALMADGKTRVIGFVRPMGRGATAYFTLGHCHTPTTNTQRSVDEGVSPGGVTPLHLRGSWETEAFRQLLANGIAWGVEDR
jgi:hypothetical protein